MPAEARGIGHEILKNVAVALLTLLRIEENEEKAPTVSEFLEESNISRTVFFSHLKRNLERAGWVEFRYNPDRTITMHLTDDGRRVAKAMKDIEDVLRKAGVI